MLAVLAVCLVLAAALRLLFLDVPLLDADESHWFSWSMLPRTLLRTTGINDDPRPDLLFPLFSRPFIMLFGYREMGIRALPAVSGLLFGLLPGLLLFGDFPKRRAWVLAAVAGWFIPISVWGSRQGIPDMIAVLLFLLCLGQVTGAWNNRLLRWAWPALLAIAALAKATTVALVPALAGMILTHPGTERRVPKVIMAACACLPLLIMTAVARHTGGRVDFVDSHRHLFGFDPARLPVMLRLAFYGLGVWVVPLGAGLVSAFSDRSLHRYRHYAWLFLPALFFPFYRVTPKEILFLLPGIVVFASVGLMRMSGRIRRGAVAAVLTAAISLLNLGLAQVRARGSVAILPDPRLVSSAGTRRFLESRLPENTSYIICSAKYCEAVFYQLKARRRNLYFSKSLVRACRAAVPGSVMLLRVPYEGEPVDDGLWRPFVVEKPLPPGSQFKLFFFRPAPPAVSERRSRD